MSAPRAGLRARVAVTAPAADTAGIADRLCGTGITEIVLQQTADLDAHTQGYPTSTSSPTGSRQVGPDVVTAWSTALARHPGMHLHLGLGLSPSWFAASGSMTPTDFAAWLAPRRDADLAIAATSPAGTARPRRSGPPSPADTCPTRSTPRTS